jgi:hypothetical protein
MMPGHPAVAGKPIIVPNLLAAKKILSQTCAGLSNWWNCRWSAAAPATCGAAIDVPDLMLVAVSFVFEADRMRTPGAKRSTHGPQFEVEEALSFVGLIDATVMAVGTSPGEKLQAFAEELPAETT